MPLPTPTPDEDKDTFITRCMGEASGEFEDAAQRRGVCETQWDEARTASATARYQHVVKAVREHPWAILPETLATIVEVVRLRASGGRLTDEEIRLRLAGATAAPAARAAGRVQIIPIFGILSHRMNLMSQVSGGTSTEQLGAQLRQALNDPGVGAIVFDVDSPGGSVQGMEELAGAIFAAREGGKPIVAVANATCASAAYWLASQATEVVVTPSGQVGSIGVLAIHEDLSKQAEMLGVKVTYVGSAPFKAEGQPFTPLTDEARADLQRKVDQYHAAFRDAVARGRSVSPTDVDKGFGKGRMVSAGDAKRAGMVDRISTLEATVDRLNRLLAGGRPRTATAGGAERTPMADENKHTPDPTPSQLKEGEVIVTVAQLEEMKAKVARLDELEPLKTHLQEQEAKLAQIEDDRRRERVAAKILGLKVPAFRPFAQVFYDLATQTNGAKAYALIDKKVLFTAEEVVDRWVAEINRQAATLFQVLSVTTKPGDADEPEDVRARVDYRVTKYLTQHKLDPKKAYREALHAVLDADPDLKAAYAMS
jgi:signal peptide peptidase SppA